VTDNEVIFSGLGSVLFLVATIVNALICYDSHKWDYFWPVVPRTLYRAIRWANYSTRPKYLAEYFDDTRNKWQPCYGANTKVTAYTPEIALKLAKKTREHKKYPFREYRTSVHTEGVLRSHARQSKALATTERRVQYREKYVKFLERELSKAEDS